MILHNAFSETYSEHCDIRNPYIFRTRDTFRSISRHILAYSDFFVMLACWQLCNIQNCNPVYLDIFKHIQVYSIMIVLIVLNFFFHINLTYFSTKFRRTCFFDCNDVNYNAWPSLLKYESTRSLKIALL